MFTKGPSLVAVEGVFKGQTFRLGEATVLGRSLEADLRLDDLSISRRHARIAVIGGHYFIEDLGSENGTTVNGRTIAAPTLLKSGDQIGLAGNLFRFVEEPARPAPGSAAASAFAGAAAKKAAAGETGERGKPDEPPSTVLSPPSLPAGVTASAPLETLDAETVSLEAETARRATAPNALIKAEQRLRAVVEIINAIQTQLDMDKLLNEILDRLFGVFRQADRGYVMLKADDSDDLVLHAARQRGREKPEALTLSRSIIQKAMGDRQAILSSDAMSDQRFSAASSVLSLRIRSMMCAPIIAKDETLGIIHLDTTRQDRQFTREDLKLLAAVTNQTAFAIANARLHRKLLLQERTERELQVARQVQESFLPRHLPEVAGMQFHAQVKAAQEVGGDFYDFIPLEGGRWAIVVGDVAGKGIAAALLAARMSSAIREFALTEHEPRRVVAQVNDRLSAMEAESSFITLIFALLDPHSRTLELVNAGHPPPLLRRSSTGQVREIQSCVNFPVGVVSDTEFEPESVQIEPGDIVCLYSDGVTEAMNAQEQSYGHGRLKSVAAAPAASAAQLMENILKDVHSFVGSARPSDDLTLVCFGAM